jgi:regulator of replication initiation timing
VALNAECVWGKTMMEVCGEDGPASVAAEIRNLRALRDTALQALKSQVEQLAAENVALALENVAMKQIVDSVTNLDNEPQYHDEGMGCGLEDRGITDRYDACRYGWDEAMERIYGEVIPCADELDFPPPMPTWPGLRLMGWRSSRQNFEFLVMTSFLTL